MMRQNASEEFIVWPTDRGYLNIGTINRTAQESLMVRYRVQTGAAIVARPAYLPPDPKVQGDSGLIVAVSRDGDVHVIQEKNGEYLWRFSTAEPVVVAPAVIGNHVYVSTQLGGMYCLETTSGKNLWYTPNVVQFVAASKERVYAADNLGRLQVLSAQSGVVLDVMDTERIPIRLHNAENDRIYLADTAGLIQCLHEVEQTEPLIHDKERKEAAETEEQPPEPKKEVTEKEKPAKKEHAAPKSGPPPRNAPRPRNGRLPRSGRLSKNASRKPRRKNRPPPEQTPIPSTSRPAMRAKTTRRTRSESGGLDHEPINP